MTHPSDIAGLSERLRTDAKCWAYATNTVTGPSVAALEIEAATALDSLSARVKEQQEGMETLAKEHIVLARDYDALQARTLRAEQQRDEAYERLKALVDADALAGVRKLVAGWNGEDRPEGPFNERHPDRLGATLPKTNCGAIYQLDDAMVAARAAIRRLASGPDGGSPLTAASDGEVGR